MQNHNELRERLKEYEIDGDVVELWNVINSNAHVWTTLKDVISVLSDDRANYIRLGYGETLEQAYKTEPTDDMICRLVHIYAPIGRLGLAELSNFISSLGDDTIWGYTVNDTMVCGFKLVMIFN